MKEKKFTNLSNNYLIFLYIISFTIKANSQGLDYYDYLDIDYTKILEKNTTNFISESKDIGPCSCNLTPDICDNLCCCDTDCSSSLIETWKSDQNNICLDKKFFDLELPIHCDNEKNIYFFNRKKSLLSYRDALSNLFCITFDNSSDKGKFYTDVSGIDETKIKLLFNKYIEDEFFSKYYSSITTTGLILNKDKYDSGDYIRTHYNSSNPYILEGKFFIEGMSPSGNCVKNRPVKFMINNPSVSCGFKYKTFDTCTNFQWNSIINSGVSFANTPLAAPNLIKPMIRNIYMRDYLSGHFSQYTSNILPNTTLNYSSSDPTMCICNNILEEIVYNFFINDNFTSITAIELDYVIGVNVMNPCKSNYLFKQTHSSKFIKDTNNFIRSGNPGYLYGSPLLIGYNVTNSQNKVLFEIKKNGFYAVGKNMKDNCLIANGPAISNPYSDLDSRFIFGGDMIFGCVKKLNYTDFVNFCKRKDWKNYILYKSTDYIQYLGIFGNANYNYTNDWTKVIRDDNYDSSIFYSDNRTCYYPGAVYLDILTAQAGAINNPQNYILGGRISTRYDNITFYGNTTSDNITIQFNLYNNFYILTEKTLTQTKADVNDLPSLPKEVILSLINNSQ